MAKKKNFDYSEDEWGDSKKPKRLTKNKRVSKSKLMHMVSEADDYDDIEDYYEELYDG